MKNILIGLAASVAVASISTGAFACPRLDSADNRASDNKGVIVLAQASGSGGSAGGTSGAAGNTGGTGKNNTVEEQTGKATSDAPGSIKTEEVQKKDTTGPVDSSVPDNRNTAGGNKGVENPANPTVK